MTKERLEELTSYFPKFHQMNDSARLNLIESIKWRRDEIRLFGKAHLIPRRHSWYGDPGAQYSYSGISLPINPWNKDLIELKLMVEDAASTKFNGVLCNLYEDGQHSNGWHSDDESELERPVTVASLTFGAERTFQLRQKGSTKIEHRLELEDGSLLIMKPPFQDIFQHQIAKTKKKVGLRLNLTFRKVELR